MKIARSLVCCVVGIVLGCSSHPESGGSYVAVGSITLARPVPAATNLSSALLGFMPRDRQDSSRDAMSDVSSLGASSWLLIDRAAQTLSLMKGDEIVETISGEGATSLAPGRFELAHKQKSALWYAPDSYFLSRGETPPRPGDKVRFRRGALGELSLFVTKDLPLHCGPVWTEEIGGVRLNESEMAKLFYSLEPGSIVEIR